MRQTRVQARPVSDIHSAYGVRRCMAWIGRTNNIAEIFRQLCSCARISMSKVCNRYLAKIDIWYIVICDQANDYSCCNIRLTVLADVTLPFALTI